jgi:putative glutamine amidotransferase
MNRPLILVPGRWAGVIDGRERPGIFAPRTLLDAIVRAGGEPVLAWPDTAARAVSLARIVDGVVLQGGDDLDLRPFGIAEVHPREVHSPPEQDACDVAVARAAMGAGLPILAICRGMQVLNIVLGGTIHPHYEESTVAHAANPHEMDVVPGTLLARVMGSGSRTGYSNHHQACDRLAEGTLLSATTEDGCVEAFESADGRVLAVQWHPEFDAQSVGHQQALFDWLVTTARQPGRRNATPAHAPTVHAIDDLAPREA